MGAGAGREVGVAVGATVDAIVDLIVDVVPQSNWGFLSPHNKFSSMNI